MNDFQKKYTFIYDTIAEDMEKAGHPLSKILPPGSSILEYGAGTGESAYRAAVEHPKCSVAGVDVHTAYDAVWKKAEAALERTTHPTNLIYHNMGGTSGVHAITTEQPQNIDRGFLEPGRFDFVFTWCVFEHVDISILDTTLLDLHQTLKKDGLMYLKINPLYFSPRGAHLSGFLPQPWVHLLFGHDTLRSMFYEAVGANPHADLIWHQYETLNRITADDLRKKLIDAGFTIVHELRKYEGKPPESLLTAYSKEALLNKDIVFVCRK